MSPGFPVRKGSLVLLAHNMPVEFIRGIVIDVGEVVEDRVRIWWDLGRVGMWYSGAVIEAIEKGRLTLEVY